MQNEITIFGSFELKCDDIVADDSTLQRFLKERWKRRRCEQIASQRRENSSWAELRKGKLNDA